MTNVTERLTAVYNFLTIKVIFMPLISIFSRKRFVFLDLSKLYIFPPSGIIVSKKGRILLGLCFVVSKSIFSCVNHHVFLF